MPCDSVGAKGATRLLLLLQQTDYLSAQNVLSRGNAGEVHTQADHPAPMKGDPKQAARISLSANDFWTQLLSSKGCCGLKKGSIMWNLGCHKTVRALVEHVLVVYLLYVMTN